MSALRVILLCMPFVSLERPSLGLGLLQAQLQRAELPCTIKYLTFDLADTIGLEGYTWVSDQLPYTAFAGDWLFTSCLYGTRRQADKRYIQTVLVDQWNLKVKDIQRLLKIRRQCGTFLDWSFHGIPWSEYDVIGFTSTFTQNISSLALARRIKHAYPDKIVVFGGANWEGEMGETLHGRFDFVDFVCTGESDYSFLELVRSLGKKTMEPHKLRGVVYRRGARTVSTAPGPLIIDLDKLPIPSYDDYFRDHLASSAASQVVPSMLLESSRGCWWGAKSHCTFCGLNGGAMNFRSKTAERVIREIRHLKERYGTDQFEFVDNILDIGYFKTLFPKLAEEKLGVSLFYEVKANLRLDQVQQLARSGVRIIQPGIESLSDHVLRLMKKGTTTLQNLQLLKWCKEYAVTPEWNLLYGFPGEESEDYEEIQSLLRKIWFLEPPSGLGPVRLDRFSPYHIDPERYGMINVRPMRPYQFLYPFEGAVLSKIAYYFDFDYSDGRTPDAYAAEVVETVQRWSTARNRGVLTMTRTWKGHLVVRDHRSGWPKREYLFKEGQALIYFDCDRIRSQRALVQLGEEAGMSQEDVLKYLGLCVKLGLMVERGGKYLALAVHANRDELRDVIPGYDCVVVQQQLAV